MTKSQSLQEQLSGIREGFSRKLSKVQPVSQVVFQIESTNAQITFGKVRREALDWVARRAGQPLPKEAWDGATFELLDVGSQRTAAIAVEEPDYWSARIDDADKHVARRIWTTELAIGITPSSDVLFGCRLYCAALAENPEFEPSIPGIVRQIARKARAFIDGRQVSDNPWEIRSKSDVDALVELLRNPARRRPVYVLSIPEGADTPLISPVDLARDTMATAHVVTLGAEASYQLTDTIGREFSVFNGAARTFRPRFEPELDQPSMHPLALASSIQEWADGGSEGFSRFLIRQALRESVARRQEMEQELPSFVSVQAFSRRQVQARAKDAGHSDTELLDLALHENESLRKNMDEQNALYEGLLDTAETERLRAIEEKDEAKAGAASLRSRVAFLEQALRAKGVPEQIDMPSSFDSLEAWSTQHLSGSVVILNRAYRAAKKSAFANPELVYRTLLALRDQYVPMRREGGLEKKRGYELALAELGLEEAPSFAGARAGEQGDEYFVRYSERRRELNRHLKGSSARDERHGFRLYFFWDEDSQQVVVGWFPSHLSTRIT